MGVSPPLLEKFGRVVFGTHFGPLSGPFHYPSRPPMDPCLASFCITSGVLLGPFQVSHGRLYGTLEVSYGFLYGRCFIYLLEGAI